MVDPATVTINQVSDITSFLTLAALLSSPDPMMPPNPGAIPVTNMAAMLINVSGTYLLSVYSVTDSTELSIPNKTTSLATIRLITSSHPKNHQLRPKKWPAFSKVGLASPNQGA